MPELHQSTGIATEGFDALNQLQRATENLLVRRLREYTGRGLRTEVENFHEIAIPAHSALAYGCRSHHFPSEDSSASQNFMVQITNGAQGAQTAIGTNTIGSLPKKLLESPEFVMIPFSLAPGPHQIAPAVGVQPSMFLQAHGPAATTADG
jgi:hypothetical protein